MGAGLSVVACSQTRISYNITYFLQPAAKLWLALRRGLVTMRQLQCSQRTGCGLLSDAD